MSYFIYASTDLICKSLICLCLQITKMTQLMKKEFAKNVDALSWMSSATKAKAEEKVLRGVKKRAAKSQGAEVTTGTLNDKNIRICKGFYRELDKISKLLIKNH